MQMDALVRHTLIHVEQQNRAAFQQVFVDLCKAKKQSVAAELATRLLLEQKEALLKPNPNRERYEFILKNLKQICPEIKTHFSKDPKRMNDPMEGLNMHAISSKGQQVIINSYQQKNGLNEKKVNVCANFAVFQKQLINFFQNAKEGEDQLFLVRHRKDPKELPTDVTRHTSPVHVMRKNNVFYFFLTDSQGGPSQENPNLHAIKDVMKQIRAAHAQSNSDKSIEINCDGGTGRLGDGTNCVILSIKEGLEMIRNTDHVYKWIQQNRINQGDNTYSVPYLPLRMVKTAQSITYITKYLNDTKQHATPLKSHKKLKDETIPEALKRHQFVGIDPKTKQEKIFNGKVAHTYLKYERQIIAHCLRNHQVINPNGVFASIKSLKAKIIGMLKRIHLN